MGCNWHSTRAVCARSRTEGQLPQTGERLSVAGNLDDSCTDRRTIDARPDIVQEEVSRDIRRAAEKIPRYIEHETGRHNDVHARLASDVGGECTIATNV